MAVDNSPLINAIARLKSDKTITRNREIPEALGYSEGVISEYLNNKKAVSELFMRKFYDKYPQTKTSQKRISVVEEPSVEYESMAALKRKIAHLEQVIQLKDELLRAKDDIINAFKEGLKRP